MGELSNNEIFEIQTSLSAIAILPILIRQYMVSNWRRNSMSLEIMKEGSDEYQEDIIMNEYVTLTQTKQRRRKKQMQHYKMHQSKEEFPSKSKVNEIVDPNEFLNFFDDVTSGQ